MTDLSRRRSRNLLGLPSVHHPRHATNLRCRLVVLGLATDQVHREGRIRQLCRCCKHESHHTSRRHHCMLDVGCWHRPLHRPPQILPSSPWQNALILHVPLPSQSHPRKPRTQTFTIFTPKAVLKPATVVLRCRCDPKLLSLRPLRPQLVVSLVLAACPALGHRHPRRFLLHWRLGRHPLSLRSLVHLPLLDSARLRHGAGSSAMGADAMGHQ